MAYIGGESISGRVTVRRNRRAMIPPTDYVPCISSFNMESDFLNFTKVRTKLSLRKDF